MPYLKSTDLDSHIQPEIIDEITRNDNDIVKDAIGSAVDLAKSYLSKYDTKKLFGDKNDAPEVDSPMLKRQVKNLACWYVLTLGNANIELELFSKLADDAIQWLKDIQKGMSNPDWPYKDKKDMRTPKDGDAIEYSSNPKQNNHW